LPDRVWWGPPPPPTHNKRDKAERRTRPSRADEHGEIPANLLMKHSTSLPLVSVIMTAYNASAYITEALDSLVSQTYSNLEFIIIDDGSTDSTWKIINKFARSDSRFRIFKLPKNSGCSFASNFAFSKAKGKYIARLDSDDIAYPDRFTLQANYMEQNPQTVMLGGQCDIISENGQLIGEKRFPLTHQNITNSLFSINPIQHPASMFRTSTIKKAKIKYDKKYIISHDLKIVFQLLPFGHLANLPEKVIYYRHRPGSLTHRNPKLVFQETVDIRNWAVNNDLYTPTLTGITTHYLESLLVKLLPNQAINFLFDIWRVNFFRDSFNFTTRLATESVTALTALFLIKTR
jgi:glycosyltransferase involved in cell wall biosynthesis